MSPGSTLLAAPGADALGSSHGCSLLGWGVLGGCVGTGMGVQGTVEVGDDVRSWYRA